MVDLRERLQGCNTNHNRDLVHDLYCNIESVTNADHQRWIDRQRYTRTYSGNWHCHFWVGKLFWFLHPILNSDPWFSYLATFYTKFRPWYHEGIIGFLWILAQPTSMYSLHKIKETMETNFHPVVVVFSNCSEPHLAITGVHLHCISVRSDFGVRFTQKLYDSLRNLYVYWNIGMERQVERDPKRSEHDTFPD